MAHQSLGTNINPPSTKEGFIWHGLSCGLLILPAVVMLFQVQSTNMVIYGEKNVQPFTPKLGSLDLYPT